LTQFNKAVITISNKLNEITPPIIAFVETEEWKTLNILSIKILANIK